MFVATPKNKKQKKKKAGAKNRPNGDEAKINGTKTVDVEDHNDDVNEEQEPGTLATMTTNDDDEGHQSGIKPNEPLPNGISTVMPQLSRSGALDDDAKEISTVDDLSTSTAPDPDPQQNGGTDNNHTYDTSANDTNAKLEALAKEREALRDEVAELRKSIESLQGKHDEDISDMRSQLEESQGEKEHAETQYRTLLGKVNTIKSQLGERLKADAVCLHTLV